MRLHKCHTRRHLLQDKGLTLVRGEPSTVSKGHPSGASAMTAGGTLSTTKYSSVASSHDVRLSRGKRYCRLVVLSSYNDGHFLHVRHLGMRLIRTIPNGHLRSMRCAQSAACVGPRSTTSFSCLHKKQFSDSVSSTATTCTLCGRSQFPAVNVVFEFLALPGQCRAHRQRLHQDGVMLQRPCQLAVAARRQQYPWSSLVRA